MPNRVEKLEGNEVEDGRLVRHVGKVIVPHKAWMLKEENFLGAGVEGTGFKVYLYCHGEQGMHSHIYAKTHVAICVDEFHDPDRQDFPHIVFNEEPEVWTVEMAGGCVKVIHDIFEALLPKKLLHLDSLYEAAYQEIVWRRKEGEWPFER